MNNTFLEGLKSATNYGYTENGAVKHLSTLNGVLDMFALGGAYRSRSDEDCIVLFQKAWNENPTLAMKCLFYLRDCRMGQGERRFFRVVMHWLASNHKEAAERNMKYTVDMGRWDDLFCFIDTPLEDAALNLFKVQLTIDVQSLISGDREGVSLAAKWAPSVNCSSVVTKRYAQKLMNFMNLTPRQYRKMLSTLRERIKVLERLMSAQRWDEIHFNQVPSKAGMKYRNAFAHNEFLAERYKAFMADKSKKVNATVLNPVDIAHQIFNSYSPDATARNAWQKYWDNLPDYYGGREETGICVCDVSGSMAGQPMEAAVAMGAYIAERGNGPFKNHFITFSDDPALVEFRGVDVYDKFTRARCADWGGSTNMEATMDLILGTCIRNHCEAPDRLYIFSDQEFNSAIGNYRWGNSYYHNKNLEPETLFEGIERKFKAAGYKMPKVIFWNLAARQDNIPALGARYSYVSGFNMSMIECILGGKDGWQLCLEKLNSERYAPIS